YGVWERSEKKAAVHYPAIKSFDSLEEMLADDAIDLVVVNTPTYTHYDFTKKALEHNKHVLVEKAFTATAEEAEELVRIAEEKKLLLGVFQNRRYDSDLKTVKKVLDSGELGDIKEAEFRWDRYTLELSAKAHKETRNAGSGLLHDLGPHLIDQAIYLFGMPASLFGFLASTRQDSVVNDYFDILLFYKSFNVRLKSSLIVKGPQPSFILHGTAGSFLKTRADVQEDELKQSIKPGGANWGREPESEQGLLHTKDGITAVTTEQGNYMELYDGWYQSLLHKTALPVSGSDAVKVMRIIAAVQKSNGEKRVVALS
ncbi:MAG: oxidoreductase, partial [Chitinophagaceae bacterium]